MEMQGKFLGIGLTNAVLLCVLFWVLTVMTKTVLTHHQVNGLTEFIQNV
jgi:hypothetical protein